VGISFYTFQTLSYTIDLYRRKIPATTDAIAFFAFVSFFPQLVAGPIERAKNLLPQFSAVRHFNRATASDGLRQMLWGFFKKSVVADNLAPYVETVFAQSGTASTFNLLAGVFFFSLQIYCDFSGYSDIAIGTARLFGFSLMRNFAYPYFARDIAEFWRRWHISLSSWFRDYVYIPLGGSFGSKGRRIVNLLITFAVSGLWHGANWTFVVWGVLNATYYIPIMLLNRHKRHTGIVAAGRTIPGLKDLSSICITFALTLIAWVFFRADSVAHAVQYLSGLLTQMDGEKVLWNSHILLGTLYIVSVIIPEWLQRERAHALDIREVAGGLRWTVYLILCVAIALLGNFGGTEFIYFQF
jgi:D-alanyl-lipoteichoic acid acyltransferase DltB (MBOAT superfamily)